MNLNTTGDGAQFLIQSRTNTRLKTQLNTLAEQLSSGKIKDTAKALGGNTQAFSAIAHSLQIADSKLSRNRETASLLTTMQRSLDSLDAQRAALSEILVKITPETPEVQINDAARNANARFGTMINTLNAEHAGRRLFAGNAVNQPALIPAEDMLADLVTAIGGATDAVAIKAAVDTWFDDPAGGFMSTAYQGDSGGAMSRRLDDATQVEITPRADHPDIRETLKGAALGALADLLPGLDKAAKTDLLFEGGIKLHAAADRVVGLQADLGYVEGEVERVTAAQVAEQAGLTRAYNDIANADPFETATALQEAQVQLETHYQMTARLSQLSLANFLR